MTLVRDPRRTQSDPGARPAGERSRVRYEDDPYTWALQQASLLRAHKLDEIDVPNTADEIADVAHHLADKLRSDLVRVLQHMIKWDHQPERRSRSWSLSIREHRRRVEQHLGKAPGLASTIPPIIFEAYQDARDEALSETDLPEQSIATECPYEWAEIMTRVIDWPE